MKPILIAAAMALAISVAPGQERFFVKKDPARHKKFVPNQTNPGELVTAGKDGVLTLDNRTANIKGAIKSTAPNEAMNAMSSWNRDSDWIEWNVDIPFDGNYFVDFFWTAGKDSGQGTFHYACGDEKIDWIRPRGMDWDHELASRVGKMSLKKGNAVFTIKRTSQKDGNKGIANVVSVKLVPIVPDYANRLNAISPKRVMDLTSRERNILWGPCAKVHTLQMNESGITKRSDDLKLKSFFWCYRRMESKSKFERFVVGDYFYTATVYNQRCVALDIAKEKMTSKEALELAKNILPNVKFKVTRQEMDTNRFTLTSLDRDKAFDLEYWHYDKLPHLTIHHQKLALDLFPEKTTKLKGCIDSMYRTIAQNALKAGKKDLFKRNWMDLNEQEWAILAGGPSAGDGYIAKRGEAQEWLFDVMSLKVQFNENGKIDCFSINSPFEIFPRDMVALASKLFPALFFESPSSTLLPGDEYTLKARGPQGRQYECVSLRYNDNTEFAITPASTSSASPSSQGNTETQDDSQPAKKTPTDYSKLGL